MSVYTLNKNYIKYLSLDPVEMELHHVFTTRIVLWLPLAILGIYQSGKETPTKAFIQSDHSNFLFLKYYKKTQDQQTNSSSTEVLSIN